MLLELWYYGHGSVSRALRLCECGRVMWSYDIGIMVLWLCTWGYVIMLLWYGGDATGFI